MNYVLVIKPGSTGRTESPLNDRVISLTLHLCFKYQHE